MFLTVKQAAGYLGLAPHQVYYLLVMGHIEGIKIAGAWRVVPDGLRAYREGLKSGIAAA